MLPSTLVYSVLFFSNLVLGGAAGATAAWPNVQRPPERHLHADLSRDDKRRRLLPPLHGPGGAPNWVSCRPKSLVCLLACQGLGLKSLVCLPPCQGLGFESLVCLPLCLQPKPPNPKPCLLPCLTRSRTSY